MNHVVVDVVALLVILGPIVFLHELGHFLAAKSFGIRVEVFSLGFGRRLTGFRRGNTDYRISALPLGGYVKMAGENPGDQHEGAPDEFMSKPRWQRLIVAFAGPFMNFVLAVALIVPYYMQHFPVRSFLNGPAVVASSEPGSPAARAGLRPQDRIVKFDGVNNPTWQDVELRAAVSGGHAVQMLVARPGLGTPQAMTVVPRVSTDQNPDALGAIPVEQVIVDAVSPNSAAAAAGLPAGVRIATIDGQPVLSPDSLRLAVEGSGGKPLRIGVVKGNQQIDYTIAPRLQMDNGQRHYLLGVSMSPGEVYIRLPFPRAVKESLKTNQQFGMLILDLVGKLVSHHASITNLQGPVSIASAAGDAIREPSRMPILWLVAMISLNLGILNLLPIPVLDGGMILFLLIESAMRHDVSLRIKERVYQAGFAFLLILMTVVIYNDIARQIFHQ